MLSSSLSLSLWHTHLAHLTGNGDEVKPSGQGSEVNHEQQAIMERERRTDDLHLELTQENNKLIESCRGTERRGGGVGKWIGNKSKEDKLIPPSASAALTLFQFLHHVIEWWSTGANRWSNDRIQFENSYSNCNCYYSVIVSEFIIFSICKWMFN